MNQTPPSVIWIVVISIAVLAFIGISSLCASLFLHTYADPAILTAIISTTSLLVGALVALLSNPRSPVMSTTTTTASDGTATTSTAPAVTPVSIAPTTPLSTAPAPVVVTNAPENPVPTTTDTDA